MFQETFVLSLSKQKTSQQHLYIGPWTHTGSADTFAGDFDFGLGSQIDNRNICLAWFDYHLKGLQT